MPIFGCASDEQLKIERLESVLKDNSIKIKTSDLRKFWYNYSLALENFIKEKGFYEEFQDRIKPELDLDCEVNNAYITR